MFSLSLSLVTHVPPVLPPTLPSLLDASRRPPSTNHRSPLFTHCSLPRPSAFLPPLPPQPHAPTHQVDRYDGQLIWISGEAHYELGNYLGGGAAGVVYEGTKLKSNPGADGPFVPDNSSHGSNPDAKSVAMKILNPVGFKLMPNGPLQRCHVARKGTPLPPNAPMQFQHVWWVVHPNSRAVIAAHQDPRTGQLRELPLPRCIEIWGWDPLQEGMLEDGVVAAGPPGAHRHGDDGSDDGKYPGDHGSGGGSGGGLSDEALEKLEKSGDAVLVDGAWVSLPRVPAKYVKWLRARQGIYREIANMSHLGSHRNVVALQEVLEYVQDSKSTLFLVLELVTGGELFDRIKIGCGTSEVMALSYFTQLLDGVGYCHEKVRVRGGRGKRLEGRGWVGRPHRTNGTTSGTASCAPRTRLALHPLPPPPRPTPHTPHPTPQLHYPSSPDLIAPGSLPPRPEAGELAPL